MAKIYVLRLKEGKYYVGETNDFVRRLKEHQEQMQDSAAWTSIYPVIEVEEVVPKRSIHDENNRTKDYMLQYGIDNVRGGSYAEVCLSPEQRATLEKELRGVQGLCFRCGAPGHYIKTCQMKSVSPLPTESEPKSPQLSPEVSSIAKELKISTTCEQCGTIFEILRTQSWKKKCWSCWKQQIALTDPSRK